MPLEKPRDKSVYNDTITQQYSVLPIIFNFNSFICWFSLFFGFAISQSGGFFSNDWVGVLLYVDSVEVLPFGLKCLATGDDCVAVLG